MTVIGIDLGTSNSAAAVLRGGRPVIIPSSEGISIGGKAFPSYVALDEHGEILVGEAARRQAAAHPDRVTTAFKRKMGSRTKIRILDREFTPEQLSGFLLQKIKKDVEAFLGESVSHAVVTVPAYFDDNQRTATKDACAIAGLQVDRLVNEPTAASLAYGLDRSGEDLCIAVIDLGGGTLDVTIMDFGRGVFEVRATSGDTQLGGTDMDEALLDWAAGAFEQQSGLDIRLDPRARTRLRMAIETAKIELSTQTTTHISLPYVAARGSEPVHLEMDVTRAQLERLVEPVMERCRAPVERALQDARIARADVKRLVFVGGPTRMPVVRRFFEQLLGRQGESGVDPMECVASGAAIQAGVLSGAVSDIVLIDVTPLTLGVETLGGLVTPLIPRNTPIPVKKTELFTTASDMQSAVTVHVFQGERPMAADNTDLGQFNLEGIAPAPRGMPKIEVTFDIDANGILNVSAKDATTGKSQTLQITGGTRLSNEEKQRLIAEAELHAAEDRERRRDADDINSADSLAYRAEKFEKEFGERVPSDRLGPLREAARAAREAVQKKDVPRARELAGQLERLLQEAGAALYGASGGSTPGPGGPGTGGSAPSAGGDGHSSGNAAQEPNSRRVVDADYEDSKK